jgi:hypothetical protein
VTGIHAARRRDPTGVRSAVGRGVIARRGRDPAGRTAARLPTRPPEAWLAGGQDRQQPASKLCQSFKNGKRGTDEASERMIDSTRAACRAVRLLAGAMGSGTAGGCRAPRGPPAGTRSWRRGCPGIGTGSLAEAGQEAAVEVVSPDWEEIVLQAFSVRYTSASSVGWLPQCRAEGAMRIGPQRGPGGPSSRASVALRRPGFVRGDLTCVSADSSDWSFESFR